MTEEIDFNKPTIVTISSEVSKNVDKIFDIDGTVVRHGNQSVYRKLLFNRILVFIVVSILTSVGFITRAFITNPVITNFSNQTNMTLVF
jgi:hypothetical protein